MLPDQADGRGKAHQALDKAVVKCYRPQPYAIPGSAPGAGFAKRVEYLFE
jgi:hypothetical protein